MAYEFETLRVVVEGGIARVTIDHPPINLFDLALMLDVDACSRALEVDTAVKVVVVDSADPDFWIAHADVEMILALPDAAPDGLAPTELGFFHALVDRFRTMPKATIAVIEGCVRGGGSELALSMDMRFAARGQATLSQPEVALGIIPGGSGTQRLPRLMGRARALEAVLGCADFDADTAAAYGWINRALDPGDLRPFVDDLARRIAAWPAHAIAEAKAAVAAAEPDPVPGLLAEWHHFQRANAHPEAKAAMRAFLANGGQTRDVERGLGPDLARLIH